jgi:Uma2 family endonuclease
MIATTSTPALFLVWSDQSEAIDLTLLQGLWTEEQYLKLTDATNCMIEFTDGAIEVLPMPTDQHQSISQFIFLALRAFMQHIGGKVHYAPLRLQIRPDKFREPDILLVRDAHDPRRQNRYWLGADLVVEIVSPDNPKRDTVTKRADYAAAGIPEYWIVNPEEETVTVLTLAGDSYADHGSFGRGTQATSALLAGFAVDVDALFDAE